MNPVDGAACARPGCDNRGKPGLNIVVTRSRKAHDFTRYSRKNLVKPYVQTLSNCIRAGFHAWKALAKQAPDLHLPLDNRCRAMFIYCHIVHNVRAAFDQVPDVAVVHRRGFTELVIRNRAVVRFKKLDKKGRASTIPTKQARLWFQQLALPGMSDARSRLVAGYVLDLLGTDIERTLITCPVDTRSVEWMMDLPTRRSTVPVSRSG